MNQKIKFSFREAATKRNPGEMELEKNYVMKGGNFMITFQYFDPEFDAGSKSVKVKGKISTKDKEGNKQHNFGGALIDLSNQGMYKSKGNELFQQFDEANNTLGNPIKNTQAYLDKILQEVPYNAVAEALKIRGGFSEKLKEKKKNILKQKEMLERQKQSKIFKSKDFVEVDIYDMPEEMFEKLKETVNKNGFDIEESPYGVIHDQKDDKVSVIFESETYFILPTKYVTKYKKEKTVGNDKNLLIEYYRMKKDKEPISLFFMTSMINYLFSLGKKFDDLDEVEKLVYHKYMKEDKVLNKDVFKNKTITYK